MAILRTKIRIEKITKAKTIAEEVLKKVNSQQIRKIRDMTKKLNLKPSKPSRPFPIFF